MTRETKKEKIETPCVNLNGTSASELQRQLTRAADALRAAMDALCDAAPNARDYYVRGPHSWPLANRQHDERLAALRKVHDEIYLMYEAIAD